MSKKQLPKIVYGKPGSGSSWMTKAIIANSIADTIKSDKDIVSEHTNTKKEKIIGMSAGWSMQLTITRRMSGEIVKQCFPDSYGLHAVSIYFNTPKGFNYAKWNNHMRDLSNKWDGEEEFSSHKAYSFYRSPPGLFLANIKVDNIDEFREQLTYSIKDVISVLGKQGLVSRIPTVENIDETVDNIIKQLV